MLIQILITVGFIAATMFSIQVNVRVQDRHPIA
ncbi:MAG: hypothetical protein ACI87E_003670 [Mariniblastus sp.]|jgi:hypothetical protein